MLSSVISHQCLFFLYCPKVFASNRPLDISGAQSAEQLLADAGAAGDDAGEDSDTNPSDTEEARVPEHVAEEPSNVKARRRKQKREKASLSHISWVADLLQDFVGTQADSEPAPPPPMPANVAAGTAREIVAEAFEFGGHNGASRLGQDHLEDEEAAYVEEVQQESGLDHMEARERKLLQKAREEFEALSPGTVNTSPFSEENLGKAIEAAIAEQKHTCAFAEDAAEEAMLNQSKLLGNDLPGSSNMDDDNDDDDDDDMDESTRAKAGMSSSSKACPPPLEPLEPAVEAAFASWVSDATVSMKALFASLEATRQKTVGQDGEVSLVRGYVSGSSPSPSPSADTAESAELETAF